METGFPKLKAFFYSVIYKPNKVEDRLLPTVQLTGKKRFLQVQDRRQETEELLKASLISIQLYRGLQ